jgi:hypothetical protein
MINYDGFFYNGVSRIEATIIEKRGSVVIGGEG